MATALYRRYRPEAFPEMIGQAHVTEPLMTALRTERIGHAYLFSGPRGCGKTTSARILARCLNCAEGPTDTPCGTCPSCVELSRDGGGSLDVVEIDAASHGGVDDARDLRERAVFAPARDRFKIFIIDEAHMVTSGGFNALLKIVEEPPPHVKFIFATTEPEKVIGTIRSRTHHYPFRLIAPGVLIDYVQQLCESEGVQVEAGVLPLVVRAGGGSVRDTLSILDQLIAGSESGAVTLERATGLLGYTSSELLDDVVVSFGARDAAAAFAAADRIVQTGQDPRRFVEDLLERLRDLIVISATTVQGASTVFRGVPDDQLQRMFEQSQLFAPGELSRIADTVSETLDRMNGATAPRLHLELMVARALVAQQAMPAQAQPSGGAKPAPAAAQPRASEASGASVPSAMPAQQAAQVLPVQPAMPAQSPAQIQSQAPAPETSPATAQSPASVQAPASTPALAPDSAVDIVATMKSAREFLRSGQAEAPAQIETPPEPQTPAATANPAATAELVSIEELREVWPELLEEILSEDRDAWNAVANVQPLSLDGDVLTIGMRSRSDLEAFKVAGADTLRDAITAALGISVKYKPTQLAAGSRGADREPATDAEPSLQSDAASGDPASSKSALSEPAPSEPASHGVAQNSAPGEALPGPALSASPAVDIDPYDPDYREPSGDSDPDDDPYAGAGDAAESNGVVEADEVAEAGATPEAADAPEAGDASEASDTSEADAQAAASEPSVKSEAPAVASPVAVEPNELATATEPKPAPSSVAFAAFAEPEPKPAPESTPAPAPSHTGPVTPAFESSGTRYGESVVREMLGARFVEERPLPQDQE